MQLERDLFVVVCSTDKGKGHPRFILAHGETVLHPTILSDISPQNTITCALNCLVFVCHIRELLLYMLHILCGSGLVGLHSLINDFCFVGF